MAIKSSNKVILKIVGGLGNQLFQFAYAYAYANENKARLVINTYYQNYLWNKGATASSNRVFSLLKLGVIPKKLDIINKRETFIIHYLICYRITRLKITRAILELFTKKIYLDGYFQGPKEFQTSAKSISKIKTLYMLNNGKLDLKNKCVIHIRAGDILKHPWNQHCGSSYYKKAINYLIRKKKCKKFEVICEDVKYAKKILGFNSNLKFLKPASEIQDFNRLCSYKYLIAANSTYSWWAGILGRCEFFLSPDFFYKDSDKPKKQKKELIIKF